MAIEKKGIDPRGILFLMLSALPLKADTNIDCNGRPFHCMNSTHFMICVDIGGGVSRTMDNFVLPCPEPTICDQHNIYECEFPPEYHSTQPSIFTTNTPTKWSEVTDSTSTMSPTFVDTTFSEETINTLNPTTSNQLWNSSTMNPGVITSDLTNATEVLSQDTTTEMFSKGINSNTTLTSNNVFNVTHATDNLIIVNSSNTSELPLTTTYDATMSSIISMPISSTLNDGLFVSHANIDQSSKNTDSNIGSTLQINTEIPIRGSTISLEATSSDALNENNTLSRDPRLTTDSKNVTASTSTLTSDEWAKVSTSTTNLMISSDDTHKANTNTTSYTMSTELPTESYTKNKEMNSTISAQSNGSENITTTIGNYGKIPPDLFTTTPTDASRQPIVKLNSTTPSNDSQASMSQTGWSQSTRHNSTISGLLPEITTDILMNEITTLSVPTYNVTINIDNTTIENIKQTTDSNNGTADISTIGNGTWAGPSIGTTNSETATNNINISNATIGEPIITTESSGTLEMTTKYFIEVKEITSNNPIFNDTNNINSTILHDSLLNPSSNATIGLPLEITGEMLNKGTTSAIETTSNDSNNIITKRSTIANSWTQPLIHTANSTSLNIILGTSNTNISKPIITDTASSTPEITTEYFIQVTEMPNNNHVSKENVKNTSSMSNDPMVTSNLITANKLHSTVPNIAPAKPTVTLASMSSSDSLQHVKENPDGTLSNSDSYTASKSPTEITTEDSINGITSSVKSLSNGSNNTTVTLFTIGNGTSTQASISTTNPISSNNTLGTSKTNVGAHIMTDMASSTSEITTEYLSQATEVTSNNPLSKDNVNMTSAMSNIPLATSKLMTTTELHSTVPNIVPANPTVTLASMSSSDSLQHLKENPDGTLSNSDSYTASKSPREITTEGSINGITSSVESSSNGSNNTTVVFATIGNGTSTQASIRTTKSLSSNNTLGTSKTNVGAHTMTDMASSILEITTEYFSQATEITNNNPISKDNVNITSAMSNIALATSNLMTTTELHSTVPNIVPANPTVTLASMSSSDSLQHLKENPDGTTSNSDSYTASKSPTEITTEDSINGITSSVESLSNGANNTTVVLSTIDNGTSTQASIRTTKSLSSNNIFSTSNTNTGVPTMTDELRSTSENTTEYFSQIQDISSNHSMFNVGNNITSTIVNDSMVTSNYMTIINVISKESSFAPAQPTIMLLPTNTSNNLQESETNKYESQANTESNATLVLQQETTTETLIKGVTNIDEHKFNNVVNLSSASIENPSVTTDLPKLISKTARTNKMISTLQSSSPSDGVYISDVKMGDSSMSAPLKESRVTTDYKSGTHEYATSDKDLWTKSVLTTHNPMSKNGIYVSNMNTDQALVNTITNFSQTFPQETKIENLTKEFTSSGKSNDIQEVTNGPVKSSEVTIDLSTATDINVIFKDSEQKRTTIRQNLMKSNDNLHTYNTIPSESTITTKSVSFSSNSTTKESVNSITNTVEYKPTNFQNMNSGNGMANSSTATTDSLIDTNLISTAAYDLWMQTLAKLNIGDSSVNDASNLSLIFTSETSTKTLIEASVAASDSTSKDIFAISSAPLINSQVTMDYHNYTNKPSMPPNKNITSVLPSKTANENKNVAGPEPNNTLNIDIERLKDSKVTVDSIYATNEYSLSNNDPQPNESLATMSSKDNFQSGNRSTTRPNIVSDISLVLALTNESNLLIKDNASAVSVMSNNGSGVVHDLIITTDIPIKVTNSAWMPTTMNSDVLTLYESNDNLNSAAFTNYTIFSTDSTNSDAIWTNQTNNTTVKTTSHDKLHLPDANTSQSLSLIETGITLALPPEITNEILNTSTVSTNNPKPNDGGNSISQNNVFNFSHVKLSPDSTVMDLTLINTEAVVKNEDSQLSSGLLTDLKTDILLVGVTHNVGSTLHDIDASSGQLNDVLVTTDLIDVASEYFKEPSDLRSKSSTITGSPTTSSDSLFEVNVNTVKSIVNYDSSAILERQLEITTKFPDRQLIDKLKTTANDVENIGLAKLNNFNTTRDSIITSSNLPSVTETKSTSPGPGFDKLHISETSTHGSVMITESNLSPVLSGTPFYQSYNAVSDNVTENGSDVTQSNNGSMINSFAKSIHSTPTNIAGMLLTSKDIVIKDEIKSETNVVTTSTTSYLNINVEAVTPAYKKSLANSQLNNSRLSNAFHNSYSFTTVQNYGNNYENTHQTILHRHSVNNEHFGSFGITIQDNLNTATNPSKTTDKPRVKENITGTSATVPSVSVIEITNSPDKVPVSSSISRNNQPYINAESTNTALIDNKTQNSNAPVKVSASTSMVYDTNLSISTSGRLFASDIPLIHLLTKPVTVTTAPTFNISSNDPSHLSYYIKNSTIQEITSHGNMNTNNINTTIKSNNEHNAKQSRNVNYTHLNNWDSNFNIHESVKENSAKSVDFDCHHRKRGRYADNKNCSKFYICVGRRQPIIRTCPVNTVFSEIWKQCTKNLSHCVRNNEFRCVSDGRFSDILEDDVYYLCIKGRSNTFYRIKFQCQNGYYLDKTTMKCILEEDEVSQPDSDNSSTASDTESSTAMTDETKKPINSEFECTEEGVFADPNDCRIYYKCKNKDSHFKKTQKECDIDDVFHKERKKCVDADSYECL